MTNISDQMDENDIIAGRRAKLNELRSTGCAFPNDYKREANSAFAEDLQNKYATLNKEVVAEKKAQVSVAGRIVLRRIMGKASFITIQDMSGKIQLYLAKNQLPEGVYAEFKKWDLGDIICAEGELFKTKTEELTVNASSIRLLTKSLRPLPDKHKGLTDQEMRYRQRYVDLITNDSSRQVFLTRSKIIKAIRQFLDGRRFIEVETPMMHVIPGGASAKPFVTHHNALDMPLYMRVAPELHLKRLIVGDFERVYEINRNFRNEGLSTKHNVEFTSLEYYQAYADYETLMDDVEALLKFTVQEALGRTRVQFQEHEIDFAQPFQRLTMVEAIVKYNEGITEEDLQSEQFVADRLNSLGIEVKSTWGLGKALLELFEATAEAKLIEPTFITQHPVEVSPLARKNDKNPFFTDRFELFMVGAEVANAFSELNDPEDQAERFLQQVAEKDAGDDEAMHYDADYIRALEYGMPPTGGVGIGIDRLVMFLTNSVTIRDVLLFPHMRPTDQS